MLKESPKLAKKSEGVILRSVHLKETPSALRTYLITCFFDIQFFEIVWHHGENFLV